MKILITENKFKKVLKLNLKTNGVRNTIDNVGGWENFCKVLNIEGPMDFLHLFDDLEQVQSEEYKNRTLFRDKKGYNYMVYDRKKKVVYIDGDEIWPFLGGRGFHLNFIDIQSLIKVWLDEVYNLRGVTIFNLFTVR